MVSRSLYSVFTRGVGRQILSFFLLAALLPVIFTAVLSYGEVNRTLEQEVAKRLRDNGKSYGVQIITRLENTAAKADAVIEVIDSEGIAAVLSDDFLIAGFEGIAVLDSGNNVTDSIGTLPDELDHTIIDRGHLADGRYQLIVADDDRALRLLAARDLGTAGERSYQFIMSRDSIFAPGENKPYLTEFCIIGPGVSLVYCSAEPVLAEPADLVEHASSSRSAFFEWESDGESQLSNVWQLFLGGNFANDGFHITVTQPESYALNAGADFRRIFPPALVVIVLIVAVLSMRVIAWSLVPLQKLTVAAGRYAGGDLGARVRIGTGDEFEELGDAFNNMAGRLGRQIDTLKAMSSIDCLILSGAEFEEVSEDVIRHLISLTSCEAAAVIARDGNAPHLAKMISWYDDEFIHERIALPQELGSQWCQPAEIALEFCDSKHVPYKDRFRSYGRRYVVVIPVVMDGDLKGILLLGSEFPHDMQAERLDRCVDLAGRLAVALTSAEREEALYRQAHFDELTGLPNRQLLKDRLEQHLTQVRRDEQGGAMLYLDLDRFKEINDVFGHSVGDIVLAQAAERIIAVTRDADTVARLGGDEFVVLMPNTADQHAVRSMATRIETRLTEAFSVRGEDHFVSASIGIVVYPDDGDSVETLLKNADSAMYRAKELGRSCFEFYSHRLNAESRRKIELERDLRDALRSGQVIVEFQPQIDLYTGDICGAEALARWTTPDGATIDPVEFVAVAEDSGLILDLGRSVIEQTCAAFRKLLDNGLHPGAMSINVSARQLRDPEFVGAVLEPLRRHDIHPGYMQLEITETTVAQNRDTAIEILSKLREQGVQVAIDDFGTGYSSLSYLQQLPFDVIKIDKSFTAMIGVSDESDNICRTIVRMAHELGKKAIAEGIESQRQADFLKNNHCDFGQGYFYSRSLSPADFFAYVEKQDFHTQRRKALEIVQ